MDIKNFIFNKEDSALLIIDIQERLYNAMESDIREKLIKNNSILLEMAKLFNMPVIVSEQYRKGLGPTTTELKEKIGDGPVLEKMHFDCFSDQGLNSEFKKIGRRTFIITGIETHVCVFQTALSLLNNNYNVIIASDAVGSRREHDYAMAIEALREAGALVYSTEMISFMLLERAGTDEFRRISPLFKEK